VGSYETTFKDIAGLKDYSVIFSAVVSHLETGASAEELVIENDAFDMRTEKGRKKVAWAFDRLVLHFKSEQHKSITRSIFNDEIPSADKNFFLLWQLCLNDRLIREITSQIFAKIYVSERVSISQDDIIGYVKNNIISGETSPDWSEETNYRIAVRFLNLMTKLGFVSTGRVKKFEYVRPSTEAQVIFLYFAKLFAPEHSDILTSPFLSLSFIAKEDIQERMKKLSMKDYFRMNFNGVALKIELTHSYEEICHVLYN